MHQCTLRTVLPCHRLSSQLPIICKEGVAFLLRKETSSDVFCMTPRSSGKTMQSICASTLALRKLCLRSETVCLTAWRFEEENVWAGKYVLRSKLCIWRLCPKMPHILRGNHLVISSEYFVIYSLCILYIYKKGFAVLLMLISVSWYQILEYLSTYFCIFAM